MNALAICYRHFPKVTVNVTRNQYFVKKYSTLADYNIKWVRPTKLSFANPKRSGDLGIPLDIKLTAPMNKYEQCKELQDADEVVKKLVSLEYQPRREFVNVRREKIIEMVKRHNLDRGSPEVKIAAMTSEIHQLQECFAKNPTSVPLKVFLKELIDKRQKLLKRLRVWDYKRFEWVLGKLNLVFKAGPRIPGKATRKDALRKLTQKHCDKIINEKLDAYRMELEKQQKSFFQEKLDKLIFIKNEELELGVEPTVTDDDIEAVRKKLERLN